MPVYPVASCHFPRSPLMNATMTSPPMPTLREACRSLLSLSLMSIRQLESREQDVPAEGLSEG